MGRHCILVNRRDIAFFSALQPTASVSLAGFRVDVLVSCRCLATTACRFWHIQFLNLERSRCQLLFGE